LIYTLSFASIEEIHSFNANFIQNITNDKGTTLSYSGKVTALQPKYAHWQYMKPVKKDIYINTNRVTIIEPEIEQVIVKHISSDFNFFTMMRHAKQITKNSYVALFKDIKYTILLKDKNIESISYKDEFDNQVLIHFSKQKQNSKIDKKIFTPNIPLEYDIIQD